MEFEEKSEGEFVLPKAQIGYLSRIVREKSLFYSRQKLSLVKPVKKKDGITRRGHLLQGSRFDQEEERKFSRNDDNRL